MTNEIMNLAKGMFKETDNKRRVSTQLFKAVHKALLGKDFDKVGCSTCYASATKEMKAKYNYILDNNLCPTCKPKVEPKVEEIKIEEPIVKVITEEEFFTLTEEETKTLIEQSELQKNIQKEAKTLERRKSMSKAPKKKKE